MQYKICRKHLSRKYESYFFSKKGCAGQQWVPETLPTGEIYQQGAIVSNKKLNNNRRATKYWGKIGRYHDWGKPKIKSPGCNVWEL